MKSDLYVSVIVSSCIFPERGIKFLWVVLTLLDKITTDMTIHSRFWLIQLYISINELSAYQQMLRQSFLSILTKWNVYICPSWLSQHFLDCNSKTRTMSPLFIFLFFLFLFFFVLVELDNKCLRQHCLYWGWKNVSTSRHKKLLRYFMSFQH